MSLLSISILTLFFTQLKGELPSKWENSRDDLRWELEDGHGMELQGEAFVKSSGSRDGIKSAVGVYPKEQTLFLDVDSVRRIMKCTDINTNKEKLEKLGKEIFNFLSLIFDYATRIINDIGDCSSVFKIFHCVKDFSYESTFGLSHFINSFKTLIYNLIHDGNSLVEDVAKCLKK